MATSQDNEKAVYVNNDMELYLDQHLLKKEFQRLKVMFKNSPVSPRDTDDIQYISQLLQKLRDNEKISIGNYGYFTERLQKIKPSLATYVKRKEKEIKTILQKGNDGSAKDVVGTSEEASVGRNIGSVMKDVVPMRHDVSTVRKNVAGMRKSIGTMSQLSPKNRGKGGSASDVGTTVLMGHDIRSVMKDVGTIREDVAGIKKTIRTMSQLSPKNRGRDPKLTAMIDTTKSLITKETENYQFLHTKSFEDARQKLVENKIVVIQGNTGDGKSSIALELLRLLCCDRRLNNRCRQPLQLHDIKDLDLVAPKSQFVIYIDNIFGKNVVSQSDVTEWVKREKDVMSKLCGNNTEANYMVITIRSEISNFLNGVQNLFAHGNDLQNLFCEQNLIELSKYTNEDEKLKLLRLYVPKHEFTKWTYDEEKQIIKSAPNIGFPQCCRLFKDTPSLQIDRVKFFERPFQYLKSSLSRLEDGKFSSLLYLFLNGGEVVEHDLDPSIENIDEQEEMKAAFAVDVVNVFQASELTHTKKKKAEFVKESLECLLNWLVKKELTERGKNHYQCYQFNHDSIEETVALLYGEKTPIGYIRNCHKKSLSYLATTLNTPNRIIISSDVQINALYERTLKEFKYVDPEQYKDFREYECLATLDVWTDTIIMQGFISWLETQNVDKKLCHLIKSALLNGACYTGSESSVTYLLSKGVTPDEITPFCIVEGGSVLLLRKLLKYDVIHTARADKSLLSSHPNINVLHQACLYDRKEMVTILCETYPNLVNDIDDKGMSPFHYVVAKGSYDMTLEKTVLKSLCRVIDEQHKCESEGGNVVHRNCVCGQYMSQLVDKDGQTILHLSCLNGHRELSLQLCELYPTLTTAVTNEGWTILHESCYNGHLELSLQLCKLYPTLTTAVTNDGDTILHISCANGHRELSLQLCKLYPKLITAVAIDGRTILHMSCMNGHKELCLQLCELYPTLTTAVTEEGYNCLHAIARFTSDVDLFTECERHVKQYVERTGGKYDITTMLTKDGSSVVDLARIDSENNSLYFHLVQLFAKNNKQNLNTRFCSIA